MTAVVAPELIQFFIPAVAAIGANVAQLASGTEVARTPRSRLSYRFTYRLSRGGPVYGCRIKASPGMAELLMERLFVLADEAEARGDSALLVGCAIALKAIEQQRRSRTR